MTVSVENRTTEFDEPTGIGARGTLVVIPGRGETPQVYRRFGARIAADGYRVRIVSNPADATAEIGTALAPVVLVGIDSGALHCVDLVQEHNARVQGLILVGLPGVYDAGPTDPEDEIVARVSCPTQQTRLQDPAILRQGRLTAELIPDHLRTTAVTTSLPILALHGRDDEISPPTAARTRYANASNSTLVSVDQGRHDPLNSLNHRTVAAHVVLFLESLRSGVEAAEVEGRAT